jgi:hypothetical protein
MPHPTEHSVQMPCSARSSSGTLLAAGTFSVRAPTGQADTHWPQEIQVASFPNGTPNDGATSDVNPRYR